MTRELEHIQGQMKEKSKNCFRVNEAVKVYLSKVQGQVDQVLEVA